VTLLEKTGELGGTINFTDQDEDKVDLRNFKNLLIREARESCPDIRMETPCSREILDEIKPDAVIIAVGAHPVKPPIKGIDRAMNALEAYHSMDRIGKRVVLAGGGLVGCEVGLHLAEHGHDVTVVEMQGMMAFETFGYYRNALLDEMDKRGLKQMLHTKVLEFTAEGVVVERDGRAELVPADTCIYSMGMKADQASVQEILKMAGDIKTYVVGDCDRAGKVGDAVHGGYEAAIDIV
jgi:NADH dehydrogenase FAD-containing subunit